MATRDRTNLFIQYRNSFGKSSSFATATSFKSSSSAQRSKYTQIATNEEDDLLLNKNNTIRKKDDDPIVVDMSSLPPKWIDLVEEVQEDIRKLGDKITQVESMHKKNLLPGFDESEKERLQIDLLTQQISSQFTAIQKRIKAIGEETKYKQTHEEQIMGKNAMTMLAISLQDLSSRFRQSQSAYLSKINGKPNVTNDIFTPSAYDMAMPNNFNMGFTEQQLMSIQSNESSINRRSKEITDIAKSIHHLAEVFRDLQTMIVDQGTLLDRIDYNIEDMSTNVKTAHEELTTAKKTQSKSKESKILIFMVIMVIILLIMVIIKKS